MDTKQQCIEQVFTGERSDWGGHRCTRKGKVEHDGKWYCAVHSPEGKAKRNAAWREKYDAERADADARYAVEAQRDADAKLGALVRAMPEGYKLWYRNYHNVWEVRINQELVSAGDTPEDALKSAGISLNDGA